MLVLTSALLYVRAENAGLHTQGGGDAGLTVGDQLSEEGFPDGSSRLWVYGNADEDDDIDEDDIGYLEGVLAGLYPETVLSDANCDGKVDWKDIEHVRSMIAGEAMDVYYVDNYYRVASVSWPVERIAIGYCSGAYVADLTGLTGKVVLVDDTIRDYWSSMGGGLSSSGSFGTTESPNYETMVAAGIDVYVVGYCDANADRLSPSALSPFGIDVMFMSTADNSGVDIPNESIDRSIVMFAYLLQGDMGKTYGYLDWHDRWLGTMREAASSIPGEDRESMIMIRTSALYSLGSYSVTGLDNTNNIHAEWVGVHAAGQHSPMLGKNYQNLDTEALLSLILESQRNGRVFLVDNAHDGMRHQYDLGECLDADAEHIRSSQVDIVYMGMAREMGNSPLYIVEMAFYVCTMYPDVAESIGLDYEELFWEYFSTFASSGYWTGLDIGDFFLVHRSRTALAEIPSAEMSTATTVPSASTWYVNPPFSQSVTPRPSVSEVPTMTAPPVGSDSSMMRWDVSST